MRTFGKAIPASLAILILVFGACNRQKQNDYTIILNGNPSQFGTNENKGRIASTTEFLRHFFKAYRSTVAKSVHPNFHNKFEFWATNANARVIFSTRAECFLYFFRSSSNSLSVDLTPYPVQASIFGGLGTTNISVQLAISEEKFLKQYEQEQSAFLHVKGAPVYLDLTNIAIASFFPKLFGLGETNIAMTRGLRFELTNVWASNSISRTIDVPDYAIFTGARDLAWAVPVVAEQLGLILAQREIEGLFVSSEFFRASLVHSRLKEKAQHILDRRERQKLQNEEYAHWEFLQDKDELIKTAKLAGLNDHYAEEFFQDFEANQNQKTLFWVFKSNQGFAVQWFSAGLLCLILAQTVIRWRKKKVRIWAIGVCLATTIAINTFVVSRMPEMFHLGYWILPGVLFLITTLPLSWAIYKNSTDKPPK